jgi:hypothetical protein
MGGIEGKGGVEEGGEMTQTLYAHMNKKKWQASNIKPGFVPGFKTK